MAGVFISYRQTDSKAWAAFLRDELADVFEPEQIFLDRDTLHAGSWREQIDSAVAQCNVTLVVIGRTWLSVTNDQNQRRLDQADDVHRHEIAAALARTDMNVIPVLVDDATMPGPAQLPENIRGLTERQARRFSDNAAHREVDVRELSADIERAGGMRRRHALPATPPAPPALLNFVPFRLDEAQARTAFAAWTQSLALAPRDLPQRATVTQLTPAWVPLWLASASVSAPWRGKKGTTASGFESVVGADGKPTTRAVDRVDYTELGGEFNERLENIVIDAGAELGDELPTLLDDAAARRQQSAGRLPGEPLAIKPSTVDRARAEVGLRQRADKRARERVLTLIGGTKSEITQFDLRLDQITLTTVHCPVFEGRYRYADREHRFCINADTGEVGGESPLSKGKLGLIALALVALVLAGVLLSFVMR